MVFVDKNKRRVLAPGEFDAMCAEIAAKGKGKAPAELTDEDRAALREYLEKAKELAAREPERLSDDDYDAVMPYINKYGEVPPEYEGRFVVVKWWDDIDGYERTGVYEAPLYEYWAEVDKLEREYHDVIAKALPTVKVEVSDEGGDLVAVNVNDAIEQAIEGKGKRPRDAAKELGAILSLEGAVTTYSTTELQHALDGFSLRMLPIGTNAGEAFDADTGQLNGLVVSSNQLITLDRYQAGFFYAMNHVFQSPSAGDGHEVRLYIPGILRDMKIDPRTYAALDTATKPSEARITGEGETAGQKADRQKQERLNAMLALINPFEPVCGETPQGNIYRALSFISYDKASETIVISSPFLAELKRIADELKHPTHRYLHSSVVHERNQAAVELANRIIIGVIQRAYFVNVADIPKIKKHCPDEGIQQAEAPIAYRVRYSNLIEDCPLLKKELAEIEAGDAKHKTQAYNAKLRHTFEAAFRIIETESELPKHYKNLQLPKSMKTRKGKKVACYDAPTKSTIRREMWVCHEGRP